PSPKFASTRGAFGGELRHLRTTSNSMILVPFEPDVRDHLLPHHPRELRVRGTSRPRRRDMSDCCLKFLEVGTGSAARRIAVRERPGHPPGLFWLGGFKSDMQGTKAVALDQWAGREG